MCQYFGRPLPAFIHYKAHVHRILISYQQTLYDICYEFTGNSPFRVEATDYLFHTP